MTQVFLMTDSEQPVTRRETEILLLVCEGLTSKEIGTRLGLSTKTVDFHKAGLRTRLGIVSTAGLVRYAIHKHLIEA